MKTITYAGTSFRISDDLADAFQAYTVMLRFKIRTSWQPLPGYTSTDDNPTEIMVQIVAHEPIVITPADTQLPDAAGSAEAAAKLRTQIDEFMKKPENLVTVHNESPDTDFELIHRS